MKILKSIIVGVAMASLVNFTHADRYALLVGVDEYAYGYDPGSLSSCVNDAFGMRRCLVDDSTRWLTEKVILLSNGDATKTAIRNAVGTLASTAVAGDVVVYFHSSHGGQNSGMDTFICTYNANYEDYEFAADLALFADGVKIIVIIDTCYSGGMFKSLSMDSDLIAPTWNFAQNTMDHYLATAKILSTKSGSLKSPAIGWITACDYHELSWAGKSYSLFTEKVIYGFVHGDTSTNGAVSFQELYDYAAPRVLIENPTQTVQSLNGSLLSATEAISVMTGDSIVEDALDQTALLVHSKPGPVGVWYAQTGTTHDGIDAVQSGAVSHHQAAEFGIRVAEPGILTFWWKTSSELNYDWLMLLVNGNAIARISGDSGWEKQTVEIGPGEHILRWIYAKDESNSSGDDCGWVDQIVWTPNAGTNNQSLAEAIDDTFLPVSTGGNQLWFNQTNTTHDAIDAAQSGVCTNGHTSWFSTELVDPGTFSFWWKVSSEAAYDFLEFYLDDELKTRISGETEWVQKTYSIGEGLHTASWCYVKDLSDFGGSDCGWVDQVLWTGAVDADGDEQNNLQEYIAGTDPTDADSYFAITNQFFVMDDLVVEWSSVSGRVYNISWTTNLLDGFQLLNPVELEYPINSYTDTVHSVESKSFYKIDVRLK